MSTLLLIALVAVASESQVEQCIDGMSGVNCDVPCRASCTTCDQETGECIGSCRYQHNFGKLCNQTCPMFCDGVCDKKTGSCNRCRPSYGGELCKYSCPTNCRSTCDIKTMECSKCQPGFTGKFCNETCHRGCPSCTQFDTSCIDPCPDEGSYGDDCEKPCPENCKDGCYRDTGECVNCAEGSGGRFCNESCPENCLNGCHRYIGTCNECKVGYSSERCSEKCPANCKDKCDKNTGYCIDCKSGFQGAVCNYSCPLNCSDICNQRSGVCKTCRAGFRGMYCDQTCYKNCKDGCNQMTGECTKCQRGLTGLFCDERCSRDCREECEQITGECIGCIDGYTMRFCNETCPITCFGNCDQYTDKCYPKATENMMLKIACGVTASLFSILLVVVIVKRRQLILNRNERDYLSAIPESNLDRASVCKGNKYYEIYDNNLAKDSHGNVRSNNFPPRDVRLPPPLRSQRLPPINRSPQQDEDLQLPPPLPCQQEPPGKQASLKDVGLRSLCYRDQDKPSPPCRENYNFDCDVVFENKIYEAVDEDLYPEVEIILPLSKGKEEQILLEEEPEHLKYSVAVGGTPAPALAVPDNEAVAAVDTDVHNIVTAVSSVIDSAKASYVVADADTDVDGACG